MYNEKFIYIPKNKNKILGHYWKEVPKTKDMFKTRVEKENKTKSAETNIE